MDQELCVCVYMMDVWITRITYGDDAAYLQEFSGSKKNALQAVFN